jgi:hypothetical protein
MPILGALQILWQKLIDVKKKKKKSNNVWYGKKKLFCSDFFI